MSAAAGLSSVQQEYAGVPARSYFVGNIAPLSLGRNWASTSGLCVNVRRNWRHMASPRYLGPERRHHRMYVTRNSEYHFRDTLCVGVRDLQTGRWLDSHLAIGRKLSGAIRLSTDGRPVPTPAAPGIGEALYFGEEGRDLITSVLCAVERPPHAAVKTYVQSDGASLGQFPPV